MCHSLLLGEKFRRTHCSLLQLILLVELNSVFSPTFLQRVQMKACYFFKLSGFNRLKIIFKKFPENSKIPLPFFFVPHILLFTVLSK